MLVNNMSKNTVVRTLLVGMASLIVLYGCSTSSKKKSPAPVQQVMPMHQLGVAENQVVERLSREHGIDPNWTRQALASANYSQTTINLMERQAPKSSGGPNGAWTRYRNNFLQDVSINGGVNFWSQHRQWLDKAAARYGVAPEYIVAIIGVETRYGQVLGKTSILDALSTLAFHYPRRAEYFTQELEHFLVMANHERFNPRTLKGSFAGAMGLGQFMPSSYRKLAVDFDGDGIEDLWNPADAIGSVANYFKTNGWQSGRPVASQARLDNPSAVNGLSFGLKTRYSLAELAARGITPRSNLTSCGSVSLLRLDAVGGYEYWLGCPNLRVISRYNNSVHYVMAVHQLAQAVRQRMGF